MINSKKLITSILASIFIEILVFEKDSENIVFTLLFRPQNNTKFNEFRVVN